MGQDAHVVRLEMEGETVDALALPSERHVFMPHFHERWEIGVITSGRARITYRDRELTLEPGSLFVFEPREVHAGEPLDAGGFAYVAVYPSERLLRRLRGAGAVRPTRFATPLLRDARAAATLETALRTSIGTSGASNPLAASECVAAALAHLVRCHASRADVSDIGARSLPRRRLDAVCELLRTEFADRISLERLARTSGVSVFHLLRTFRRTMGITPCKYLETVRVEQACRMLRAGMPISHVAYSTGFSDQSHLTRRFKRVVGVTPGVYARGIPPAPPAPLARSA